MIFILTQNSLFNHGLSNGIGTFQKMKHRLLFINITYLNFLWKSPFLQKNHYIQIVTLKYLNLDKNKRGKNDAIANNDYRIGREQIKLLKAKLWQTASAINSDFIQYLFITWDISFFNIFLQSEQIYLCEMIFP